MIRKLVLAQPRRLWFLLGCATLFLGVFVKLTQELLEGTSGDPRMMSVDQLVLMRIAAARVSWLNGPAVDITALGSTTVLVLLTGGVMAILSLLKDRRSMVHLLLASVGAGLTSQAVKHLIQRPRPEVIERLVEVSGYSYPSGHSLAASTIYFTFAILGCRHFHKTGERVALFLMSMSLIGLIALSRVYLGVHFPSDILSGVSLGAAWAFLLAAAMSKQERRAAP